MDAEEALQKQTWKKIKKLEINVVSFFLNKPGFFILVSIGVFYSPTIIFFLFLLSFVLSFFGWSDVDNLTNEKTLARIQLINLLYKDNLSDGYI